MKRIKFYKYHGTGNDFIMIDNRDSQAVNMTADFIQAQCHRRFGIGADGLILLEKSPNTDFRMNYFNADGAEASMCGNGGRCIAAFAQFLGIASHDCTFEAVDGIHQAKILSGDNQTVRVSLKMGDVSGIEHTNKDYILDTGSPHFVSFYDNIETLDVVQEGKKIRYNNRFNEKGINVNFVSRKNDGFNIRTYERGVENETFSCGTGTVAAAIAVELEGLANGDHHVEFQTLGGKLEVSFERQSNNFANIWLTGDTVRVFEGIMEL